MVGSCLFIFCCQFKKKGNFMSEKKKEIRAWIIDLAIAVLIAAAVSMVMKPTIVKETSMEPNFHDGDYLILNRLKTPEVGDVIVFRSDVSDKETGKKLLIKRVIAKEGDSIKITEFGDSCKVLVNGEKEKDTYTKEGTSASGSDVDIEKIPSGEYFVMGDNRDVSFDSRDIGCIKKKDVVGTVMARLYPFNKVKIF